MSNFSPVQLKQKKKMANGGGYQRSGSGHPPEIRALLAGRLRSDPGGAPPLTRPRSPPLPARSPPLPARSPPLPARSPPLPARSPPLPARSPPSPARYTTPVTPHNKGPTSRGTFNTRIVVTLV